MCNELQLRGVLMGVAMLAVMHLYFKYTQPLFIQGLMGLKNLYEAKTIAIHVFGKKAEGDLARPFKAAPGMFGGKYHHTFVCPVIDCIAQPRLHNLRRMLQRSRRQRSRRRRRASRGSIGSVIASLTVFKFCSWTCVWFVALNSVKFRTWKKRSHRRV